MDEKVRKWIDENIDFKLENKNVFVTGGNSGIGFEFLKECAYLKANLFMLVRNIDRGNKAKEQILKEYPNAKIELIELDLSSFKSIENALENIKKYDIDIFLNNAGVYRIPEGTTKEGFEIVFGTNFIGTLYLNDLLIKYLETLNHDVNLMFTTSVTSRMFKINYKDFYYSKRYKPLKAYGRSKVAINNMYFNYLDEYKNSNVVFKLVHPGATYTPLMKKGYKSEFINKIAKKFMDLFFHTPDKAALSNVYALRDDVLVSGPRGFLEISGYPHKTKFKKDKKYKECILIARNDIKTKIAN